MFDYNYATFCISVFLLQFAISMLSFVIGAGRLTEHRKTIDILVGISWFITSCWWLFCGVTGTK